MNARETAIQALSVCRWCGNTDTANLRFDPIVDPPWLCQRCWEARNKIPIEEPIQALPPITTTTPKPHRTEGSYRRAPKAVRADAIAHYGGKCEWCEATEQLEFDHIHNDGAAHRRTLGDMPLEEWLRQEGYPLNIVRLLCRPCHELKTWGHVTQKTAKQRLVHSLRRRPDTMPPRHGATTVHITLAADANRLLDDLAALEPNKSKSRIIEGLIRQTMTTSNGHQVDLLSGLVLQRDFIQWTKLGDSMFPMGDIRRMVPPQPIANQVQHQLAVKRRPGQDPEQQHLHLGQRQAGGFF